MMTTYLVIGLVSIVGAAVGLALTCHLEKRALTSKDEGPATGATAGDEAEGLPS